MTLAHSQAGPAVLAAASLVVAVVVGTIPSVAGAMEPDDGTVDQQEAEADGDGEVDTEEADTGETEATDDGEETTTQAETETDSDPAAAQESAESTSEPEATTEPQSEPVDEADSEPDTEPAPQADGEPAPEADPESTPEPDAESAPEPDSEPTSEPEPDTEAAPEPEPDMAPEADPELEPESAPTPPTPEADTDPDTESADESVSETEAELEEAAETVAELAPEDSDHNLDSDPGSDADPESDPEPEASNESRSAPSDTSASTTSTPSASGSAAASHSQADTEHAARSKPLTPTPSSTQPTVDDAADERGLALAPAETAWPKRTVETAGETVRPLATEQLSGADLAALKSTDTSYPTPTAGESGVRAPMVAGPGDRQVGESVLAPQVAATEDGTFARLADVLGGAVPGGERAAIPATVAVPMWLMLTALALLLVVIAGHLRWASLHPATLSAEGHQPLRASPPRAPRPRK